MQLSQMQDLAGVRIVVHGGWAAQDEVVETLRALFPNSKIKDRRREPQHGYRAVHVICELDGRRVEIQVRTLLQHEWAELFEKLADRWGRQIRYGEKPNDPNTPVAHINRAGLSST